MAESTLSPGLRRDAELVAGVCMSVAPGDVVTIITDDAHLQEANALAQVVVERGGFPVIANNEHQVRRALADMRFPMAPPRNLHQAMTTSDEIIIITNLEWANRFAHVSAVRESCDNNAKIASVEEGIGAWDLTEADIRDATDRARAAIAALAGAKWCRVTSPAGTDVRVSIEGRPALEVTPIKQRGQMMGPVPLWSEVAFAAVEDRTEGTIVVDGIMLGIGLPGQTPHPITWKVHKGHVTEISGGRRGRAAEEGHRGGARRRRHRRVRLRHQREVAHRLTLGEGAPRHRPLRPRRQPQRLSRGPKRQHPASGRQLPERLPPQRGHRRLHRQGRQVGALGGQSITVVSRDDVAPVPLPNGSWSRMVVNGETAPRAVSSLGYSVFTPGTVTGMVAHQVEEVAYVLSGRGELRTDGEPVPFAAHQALHIPAGLWHAVANTGEDDLAMVFGFPHPGYPPTERR